MASLWFERAWIGRGWEKGVRLRIADGRIAAVETGIAADAGDERHRVGLPGLCNVHSHGFQRGMAGLSERRSRPDDNFWSWREIMYRFLDRLTPADVAAITAQAYAEMLETGFTRVGELGADYARMGVYLGRHPSMQRNQQDGTVTEGPKVQGKLLGKDVEWNSFSVAEDGTTTHFQETLVQRGEGFTHVWVVADKPEDLAALRAMAETIH